MNSKSNSAPLTAALVCGVTLLLMSVYTRASDDRDDQADRLAWVNPSQDRTHFVEADTGKRFVVWGVNYDHDGDGRLLEDYWQDQWPTVEQDFDEIKQLGANVVRVHLQLGRFMDTPTKTNAQNLERLADLVSLAERTGLYLDITGLGCYHKQDVPAWYDALGEQERWDVQARFWRAVAEVCADSPAIFCYDLMNEPVLPGNEPATDWLAGEFAGKHFVQRISLDLNGRTRQQVATQWVKQLTDAIREADDRHMITVGVIPWAQVFKGAKPLFHDPQVGKPLDFVSVHFYPETGKVDEAIEALKVYDIGKPLLVEEIFPLRASIEDTLAFIDQSRAYCDGWVSFYWGRTIEQNEARGDIQGAITASWLRAFREHAEEYANAVADSETP